MFIRKGVRMARIGWFSIMVGLLGSAVSQAQGFPTTIEPVVGAALLCRDQIDPYYFYQYLNTHFNAPVRTEGGAYWFKAEGELYGLKIRELFVSTHETSQLWKMDFIGAIVDHTAKQTQEILAKNKGMNFRANPYEQTLRAGEGSIIRDVSTNGQEASKLYCVKYRVNGF